MCSVTSAYVVAYIFKEGIEDETELVIISKPISRRKIMLTKFTLSIIVSLIIGIVGAIISLFTMCYGKYDGALKPNGINFGDVPKLFGSIILATFIIFLIFGSIGLLIGMYSKKIHVIVSVSAIAIISNVINTVAPLTLNKLSSDITNRYGGKINSILQNEKTNDYKTFAYTKITPEKDLYKQYLEFKNSNNLAVQMINVSGQLSTLYQSFDLVDEKTTSASTLFGNSTIHNTIIKDKNDNFTNYLINYYSQENKAWDDVPLLFFAHTNVFNDTDIQTFLPSGYDASKAEITPVSLFTFGAKHNTGFISNYKARKLNERLKVPLVYVSTSELEDLTNDQIFHQQIFKNITLKLVQDYQKMIIVRH